jgi:hypothetical protein
VAGESFKPTERIQRVVVYNFFTAEEYESGPPLL